jgi:cystathionine beta-lyase
MKYNFDKETERRGTYSLKWDEALPLELPMWVADMDFETAPSVKAAVKAVANHGVYGYSVTPCEYFSAISDFWYDNYSYRMETGNIAFSTGVVAALSSLVRKLSTPAENVLIQAPVYNIFYNSILNNGRNVISSDLVYKNEEYSIDFADLEEKLSDKQTSLMILCNPHNPIGKIWDRETLEKIGALCFKYGVTVISDEIHSPITRPGLSYVPFASVNEICENISVTCLSASKAFNLAGLQSAAVYAKNPVLFHKAWRALNTDEVGEPNIFAMRASIAAYKEGREWLDELRKYLFSNRDYAEKYIKENMPKCHPVYANATYLMWLDVSAYTDNSDEFARTLREKTGLWVSGGMQYGKTGRGFVRINLATQRKRVEDAMRRLHSFINSLE